MGSGVVGVKGWWGQGGGGDLSVVGSGSGGVKGWWGSRGGGVWEWGV